MKYTFCELSTALSRSILDHGAVAASAADDAMPFSRPSRAIAEGEGIRVRFASVLFAIYPMNGSWHGLLMQRAESQGVHSGQISIPGGERENGDDNLMETARREFFEEVGIVISPEVIIGPLSERFIPSSRFAVTPYIAVLSERPNWSIDSKEVAAIIEFSIDSLIEEHAMRLVELEVFRGVFHSIPAYPIQGHEVWGATALILTEFMEHWIRIKEGLGAMQ